MFNLRKSLFVAILGCGFHPVSYASSSDGEWKAGAGITGVGEINKISPKATEWLHFDKEGHEGGETASFTVDTRHASDEDNFEYCDDNDELIVEVTDWLDEGRRALRFEWSTNADTGSIDGSGNFTAGPSPKSNGQVWVDIMDSRNGYDGERLPRKRYDGLMIFRVGVNVMPAGVEYWEDDKAGHQAWFLEKNLSGLHAHARTGKLSTTDDRDTGPGWSHSVEWETITEPAGGGRHLQKNISYTPYISGRGSVQIWYNHTFLVGKDAAGLINTVALGLAGTAGGPAYIAAGIVFGRAANSAHIAGGGNARAAAGISSVIEFVGKSSGSIEERRFPYSPNLWRDSSLLTVSPAVTVNGTVSVKGDVVTRGSTEANSDVEVVDNSLEGQGQIQIRDGGTIDVGSVWYGLVRPSYR